MGKYGKKSIISEELSDYLIMIGGLTGVGKTTTITEVAEKLYGEDGYLLLDTGDEDGVQAIEGVNSEPCKTYKKYLDVCTDIAKHKDEYPELRVVIIDTLDSLLKISETYAIEDWNKRNIGKQGFVPAKSKNSIEGGYGASYDIVFELVYKCVRMLKKVGVGVWFTAHQQNKDLVDPYTESSYRIITSKMANRYFDDFVTKLHVVGMIVEDRSIEAENTGRKDIKKKDITVNRVKNSTRKIVFRDANVNSKSRFKYIIDEIPLDADAFIKAIKDAIKAEKNAKHGKVLAQPKSVPVEEHEPADVSEESADDIFEEEVVEESEPSIDYATEITTIFKSTEDKELKATIRAFIKDNGGKISEIDEDTLADFYAEIK